MVLSYPLLLIVTKQNVRCARISIILSGIWRGFHKCPFGFSVYVSSNLQNHSVYSGLRVIAQCDKKQLRNKATPSEYSPNIPEEAFRDAIERIVQTQIDLNEAATQTRQFSKAIESLKRVVDDQQTLGSVTLHELRRLNADLKAYAEGLTAAVNNSDFADLRLKSETIFATSTLISVRLDAYDLETNPEAATTGNRKVAGVYRKFDKSRRCLEVTRERGRSKLKFEGSTYVDIFAFPIFDLLPYVLLENAIKYTPEGETVHVEFGEATNGLTVRVSSLGPLLEGDEGNHIFTRGFRGRHATNSGIHGTGIGLYLAARVAEIHDLKVTAHVSGDVVFHNNVPYTNFCIEVHFARSVVVGSQMAR